MGDAPGTWADYINWAQQRVGRGGIAELARRTGLHRSTLFEWKNGQGANPTVESIRLVADAVGDDPRNALQAAGRLPAGDEAEPRPRRPTLPELLSAINATGAPLDEKLDAAEQVIAMFRQDNPASGAGGHDTSSERTA